MGPTAVTRWLRAGGPAGVGTAAWSWATWPRGHRDPRGTSWHGVRLGSIVVVMTQWHRGLVMAW